MKFKTFSKIYNVKEKGIVSLRVFFDSYEKNNLILFIKNIYEVTEKESELYEFIAENEEIKQFWFSEENLFIIIK